MASLFGPIFLYKARRLSLRLHLALFAIIRTGANVIKLFTAVSYEFS
jgi:hypothetical protein